ncbi:serine hydrolase [Chryseobacterium lactis]|uniref:Serine hydrolase n=1 Tax=Chryseobacterium lactis TaxID=1241981 RepID=A0A3G6RQ50_CHRLC|nr:serine hydrolase domain-containing protein [Chryseobacterium lactis]AZA80962.1 class A beta-lactamase-related serine hydrolase [Chryseobacterium lactis]AZB05963.1 class A beta-lactamase-related serine hydrolase [Chryseobacterium lactis]PNW13317.1 serine hydrolase [Chryseobacterium lactis]
MIKNLTFLLLFCFLFSCKTETPQVPVDKKAIIDSTITAFQKTLLEQQIDSVFKKYHFNGSIAVFKDSLQLYRKESGYADFKRKTKIDSNTIFAIGSVSKQFTAALVLLQMEQGKLNVTDKASKYLKEFQNKEYENITIHQLLNHTSGLNLLGGKLMFKSGSDFFYSNDGFNALGKIVEKVSGESYDQNVEKLLKKAGMTSSSTGDIFKGNNFASAYLGNGTKAEEVPNMPKRLGGKEIGTPAGGILSTIRDLHTWNNALYGGKILKPETLKMFMAKSAERRHAIFGKMGYAYGIMLNIGKPNSYFHSGYIKGSPSLNIYYPDTKTSVIILSNIADEEKGKGFTFRPHIEVKKITDNLENTLSQLKQKN